MDLWQIHMLFKRSGLLSCTEILQRIQDTMGERERQCNGKESPTDQPRSANTWRNGQCVASVLTSSWVTPRFDSSDCRTRLETKGFQANSSRRFRESPAVSSGPSLCQEIPAFKLIHFSCDCGTEQVLYIVLWCAVYSTLHMYLESSTTDFWVLCLCVSLVSIIITAAILLVLHYSNKEVEGSQINMNTDVRLVAVNEHTIKHRLLLGVADWVQQCRGKMQKKLKKKMSYLILVTEVPSTEPEEEEELLEEERPLLLTEQERSHSRSQREDSKLTQNFSLMPNSRHTSQAIAENLLMAYSALYVRLLVSNKLPVLSQSASAAGRHHCYSSLCLCEFVELKVLQ
ncbi:hypothetical protein DNTS_033242 [Danionella cerebrum]|uniref:Uncharacterized protein n=1 Tax=Danionella cerebrum TaxID=2873325 RepID=A0A553RGP6_9TELE|nr:hypothetical protein DNTS_033242 [Danionella translucida]